MTWSPSGSADVSTDAGASKRRVIRPMKAAPGELPPSGDDWAYELKWDGMRVIAHLDEDGVRLFSGNGNEATNSYPELQGLRDVLDGFDSLILDGEVVAIDVSGVPNFGLLQQRMHVQDPQEALRRAASVPISYALFDVLSVNGTDTMRLPLRDRRTLLEQIVEPGSHWRLTDMHVGDSTALLETVIERGLEGIVAKNLNSVYVEGKRPKTWVKIKPRHRQEFVVGGWSEGRDGNTGSLGSLLLGVMEGDELIACGSVGSGLTADSRRAWMRELRETELPKKPFVNDVPPSAGRKFHWCEALAVIEVAFGDWTDDGHLRHPVYLGRRTDKDPAEVVREIAE